MYCRFLWVSNLRNNKEILRKGKRFRTHVHGRPAVIVYTSMCTSIVLYTWKTFIENIEITIKFRHRFAWSKLHSLNYIRKMWILLKGNGMVTDRHWIVTEWSLKCTCHSVDWMVTERSLDDAFHFSRNGGVSSCDLIFINRYYMYKFNWFYVRIIYIHSKTTSKILT